MYLNVKSATPHTGYLKIGIEAGKTPITPSALPFPNPFDPNTPEVIEIPIGLELDNVDQDLSGIGFTLFFSGNGNPEPTVLHAWNWQIHARPTFRDFILPYVYTSVVFFFCLGVVWWWRRRIRLIRERTERELADASSRAKENPDVARYAWDVARVKLEAYFDRNLIQVNLVFWVAALVMAVGFAFVLVGVWFAYLKPDSMKPSLVAAISGIITQFIGATFMVIYRSTMSQASEFMTVLERINSVGMAVQVLDSLKDGTDLKDETRAEIAKLLLSVKSDASPTLRLRNKRENKARVTTPS
jgi:hypothetical protein